MACSTKKLLKIINGIVPDNMEELQNYPGIGRKRANVIMLEAFHNPHGIAVDTHAKRYSKIDIGFYQAETDPGQEVEKELLKTNT